MEGLGELPVLRARSSSLIRSIAGLRTGEGPRQRRDPSVHELGGWPAGPKPGVEVPLPGGCPSGGPSSRKPGLTLQGLTRHWITSFRWFRLPRWCQLAAKGKRNFRPRCWYQPSAARNGASANTAIASLTTKSATARRHPERRHRPAPEQRHRLVRPGDVDRRRDEGERRREGEREEDRRVDHAADHARRRTAPATSCPARSRLKTATSRSCPTRNAVPEPIATRRLTSGPNGPSICAPTKLQASPTTKPATTTRRAARRPVQPVHQVGDEEGERIGEGAPGQPVADQELHQDVRGDDDHRHGGDAGEERAGHRAFRFGKVAETWPPRGGGPRLAAADASRTCARKPQARHRGGDQIVVVGIVPVGRDARRQHEGVGHRVLDVAAGVDRDAAVAAAGRKEARRGPTPRHRSERRRP